MPPASEFIKRGRADGEIDAKGGSERVASQAAAGADELQFRHAFAGGDEAGGAAGDGEFFLAEQLADLGTGVLGPGAGAIKLDVGMPVMEGFTALALALIGQGQVVMRIGVAGGQNNSLAIGDDRFVKALQLIQYVAEIEEGKDVAGVHLGGAAIKLLRQGEVTLVE